MEERPVYTLHQVARLLQVPYRRVRDEVFAGRWPHLRISQRTRRMSADDIDGVLAMLHRGPSVEDDISVTIRERAMRERVQAFLGEGHSR